MIEEYNYTLVFEVDHLQGNNIHNLGFGTTTMSN